jgi:nitrogen fixation protein FixH
VKLASRLQSTRPRGFWIPWLFVAFFLLVVAVNGAMIWYASRSWTGMATDHAYDKGLSYNRNLAAAQAQAALGWRSQLTARVVQGYDSEAELVLSSAEGVPIEDADVVAAFERPTSDGLDFKLPLEHRGKGVYRATFELPLVGLWQVHVTARRGSDLHVHDEWIVMR